MNCHRLIGWTLIEITSRSLFALNRVWPPVVAVATGVAVNLILTAALHSNRPELLGLGASCGLAAGFLTLFGIVHARRKYNVAGA